MKIDFSIDRDAGTAVYRQIMSGITTMVRDGKLVPGDRLPSEREIADHFGISRGTAKKAYDKLCTNGVTQSVVGSGTFISLGQDVISAERKQQALDNIENLVGKLSSDGFSYREIETHFNLVINKYRTRSKLARIAAVDCSPEALYTFEEQLGYIQRAEIDRILLTDLEEEKYPSGFFVKYDLILTTSTHHEEIRNLLPEVDDRIMQAIVSPGTDTVIELARIPKDKTVAVIGLSERYLKVILKFMTRDVAAGNTLVLPDGCGVGGFLDGKDYLILPPRHILDGTELDDLSDFLSKGGKVIYFNYQIERGSLIHIEEKISEILHKKIGGAL
ncbi:MAG: GntR family transcriptional regulator [Clostridia bacterium]|nr:GntR family transcriptional regulator [Clostridia bacterium]